MKDLIQVALAILCGLGIIEAICTTVLARWQKAAIFLRWVFLALFLWLVRALAHRYDDLFDYIKRLDDIDALLSDIHTRLLKPPASAAD